MAGYRYDYTCPSCGSYFQLRMRTALTKRRCSYCGWAITRAEIDRQAEARAKLCARQERIPCCGCTFVLLVLAPIAFVGFGIRSRVDRPDATVEQNTLPPPPVPRRITPDVAKKAAYALSVARDLEQSGMYYNATKAYREIVKRFPGTREAEVAEGRITALRPHLKNPD